MTRSCCHLQSDGVSRHATEANFRAGVCGSQSRISETTYRDQCSIMHHRLDRGVIGSIWPKIASPFQHTSSFTQKDNLTSGLDELYVVENITPKTLSYCPHEITEFSKPLVVIIIMFSLCRKSIILLSNQPSFTGQLFQFMFTMCNLRKLQACSAVVLGASQRWSVCTHKTPQTLSV